MNKVDYFNRCMQQKFYEITAWNIAILTVCNLDGENGDRAAGLFRDDQGYYFYDGPEDLLVRIDDADPNQPLFAARETITLKAGVLPNLDEDVETLVGQALVNGMLLVYPFGNKIPYMNGEITADRIESILEKRCVDDLDDEEEMFAQTGPNAPIFIYELMKFHEAAAALDAYSQVVVPSATPKMLQAPPGTKEKRQELLDKYRDQLDDPVIQAKITEELIKLDKDWLADDDAMDFYIKGKFFDVIRKKRFLLHGSESGFGVEGKLIEGSLEEGWQIEHLPSMSNGLRSGSHSRGAQTALGGEATKFNYRMYQNSKIVEDDCGSDMGLAYRVTAKTAKNLIGSYYLDGKNLVSITEQNHATLIDKVVRLRSPIYCRTEGHNFCKICMGDRVSQTPDALATYAADVSSAFMGAAMKAMHGKALKTARYNIEERLS